jgi:hypothetical protein
VLTAGADQDSAMEEDVWRVLMGEAGPCGDVDCDSNPLRKPSPTVLFALIWNRYSRPPSKPLTTVEFVDALYWLTTMEISEPVTPVSLYSV